MRLFRRSAWMRQWLDPLAMALAAVAVVATVGCPARQISRRAPREAPRPQPSAAAPGAAHAGVAPLWSALAMGQARPAAQKDREPAPRPAPRRRRPSLPSGPIPVEPNVVPPVSLTEQLQEACWFRVGDEFPDLELPAVGGGARPLSSLMQGKPTVVVIWSPGHPYAREELADLPKLLSPFGDAVSAAAVAWGAPAEAVRDAVEPLELPFPVLVDADRAALPPRSPVFLPQTYLLDPQRKVLWLDLEYSRSTRRQLEKALRVTLGQP